MNAMIEGRLVLKLDDEFRHLASYALEDDGSLYLFLVREGTNDHRLLHEVGQEGPTKIDFEGRRPKTKKISYHASGLVRYHNADHQKVFREPLCAVSTVNPIVAYVIPSVQKLDRLEGTRDSDFVFELETDSRMQFSFCVTPWQHVPSCNHAAIRFHNLFALVVEIGGPVIELPKELAQHVTTCAIKEGFPVPLLDEPTAFARFHQQMNQTQSLILYSPNAKGEYRLVCAVPMRIPPSLEIRFVDKSYTAETLPPHPKRGTVEVRFRVKGKGGYIRQEVPIEFLALDARL
ncbi:hypothetical protein JAO05_15860 [Burkholderia pseudomallei]|uniref:hypothetical protein n=1 Tax=Burkholderia TaxID=32008 RepID=UPI00163F46C0|nr:MULTISPECIES: hypothetical protein [Burkholderia]MBH9656588.1 hypothetical protein [Burkholderia pseudomallei]